MNILITGAGGFIRSALCIQLSTDNKIIGVDITKGPDKSANIVWEQADPPATRCEALRAGGGQA
jgi:nucleoside-diphosphate-sugar epimerase